MSFERPAYEHESSAMKAGRRELLRLALGGTVGGVLTGARLHAEDRTAPSLIVRSRRPLDAETPVEVFDRWLTPNSLFFVRSHFGAPAVGLSPWRLEVVGLSDRNLSLSLDDLAGMNQVKIPAVLQCSGNGRANYSPRIPGVGWERGAVGNAEWSGVRLVDLLRKAGIKREALHVHLRGADGPPSPKTPAFLRSIPIERALDENTIVALKMNAEPLPLLHGGPIRLVVPGWAGNHWMKWLRQITLAKEEAPGFYMQTGYKVPRKPTPPGVDLKPADLKSVTVLSLNSLIASPSRGAILSPGRLEVRGVAWTGEGRIDRVEVSVGDAGVWKKAELIGPDTPFGWRLWRFAWEARQPGRYELRARAVDARGETQPESTPWNRSGYLWNGVDRVTCEVRGS